MQHKTTGLQGRAILNQTFARGCLNVVEPPPGDGGSACFSPAWPQTGSSRIVDERGEVRGAPLLVSKHGLGWTA